jgi:hypothetical protein
MKLSSCETFQGFRSVSFSRVTIADCPVTCPNSSARYDLAVVVSRPVSIFLRVLTGFFISFSADYALMRRAPQTT